MSDILARFVGVELYFEDLERAKKFYLDTLCLHISDEQPGHPVKFGADARFVCLETKDSESYPSGDKAVLFFEVRDLRAAVTPSERIASYARSPIGLSFTIRKDTTFFSWKPVSGDRPPAAHFLVSSRRGCYRGEIPAARVFLEGRDIPCRKNAGVMLTREES